jgi:hypothetical protein
MLYALDRRVHAAALQTKKRRDFSGVRRPTERTG